MYLPEQRADLVRNYNPISWFAAEQGAPVMHALQGNGFSDAQGNIHYSDRKDIVLVSVGF